MPGTITPIGAGTAILYSRNPTAQPTIYDKSAPPGATNAPIIFEPPAQLTAGMSEIWIVASGGVNWGGCVVMVSSDNATYAIAGQIKSGGRQGFLTAPLPVGPDPDTGDTLAVDLTESSATLLSGTQADADNLVTLCYCDGELVSYKTATLTAAHKYNLTYLRRGIYGTTISSHSGGSQFARIGPTDDSVLQYRYPSSFINSVIYLKFVSFNNFGGAAEDVSLLPYYAYSLQGHGLVGGTGQPTILPFPLSPAARGTALRVARGETESNDEPGGRRGRRFI